MGRPTDIKLIPGTEVVFEGTDGESASSQELVLIPRPTKNVDDPPVSLPSVISGMHVKLRTFFQN